MTTRWSPGAGPAPGHDPLAGQAERAAALRALHRPGDPLVLPNVWDAASARVVARAGFPAVATSSGAVAAVLGHEDGERMPVAEALDAVARVAAAVTVPVTADVERGYGLPPEELVRRVAATGAVGINLEDTRPGAGVMVDPEEQADLLAGVRQAARAAGLDLVVNARVDVYLRGGAGPGERLAEAHRRARRYREAGADCVYPIGLAEPDAIRELAAEGPVNVLFRPGVPAPAELAALGVARISFGSGPHRAVMAYFGALVAEVAAGRDPYPG